VHVKNGLDERLCHQSRVHCGSARYDADMLALCKKSVRHAVCCKIRHTSDDTVPDGILDGFRLLHNLFFHIERITVLSGAV